MQSAGSSGSLLTAIGFRIRPYFICFVADFLIAAILWLLLWLFKKLASVTPIEGWQGEYFVHLHSLSTVLAYGMLMCLLIFDIIKIYKREGNHERTF